MEFIPPIQLGRMVKGQKVLDLDPIEAMEFENKLQKVKKMYEEKKRLELDLEELSVWMRKWWLEIRKKHKIDIANVTYDEGAVYEIKSEQL